MSAAVCCVLPWWSAKRHMQQLAWEHPSLCSSTKQQLHPLAAGTFTPSCCWGRRPRRMPPSSTLAAASHTSPAQSVSTVGRTWSACSCVCQTPPTAHAAAGRHRLAFHSSRHVGIPLCTVCEPLVLLLTWSQATPFDPAKSSTARWLGCSDKQCQCGSPSCSCRQDKCYYTRHYGEVLKQQLQPCRLPAHQPGH